MTEISEQGDEEVLRRLVAVYEARLAEVAQLAAHVRHEVNNPLTGLMGQAQLLLREDLSDAARHRVRLIQELAGRIRDTVAELRQAQSPLYATAVPGEADDPPDRSPRG